MKLVLAVSLAALLILVPSMFRQNADKPAAPAPKAGATVTVQLLDDKGALTGPVAVPAVVRSDKEWQARLTPEQFRILRTQGTERAFCGLLWDHHEDGTYCCRGCGLPLFASEQKFESGTGWPSYWAPVAKENVRELVDNSYGMRRVEIRCARCDGHLGHVFDDGPPPTGQRHCLNSESLVFVTKPQLATQPEGGHQTGTAYFAAGCFWGVEEAFRTLPGVTGTAVGYMGGSLANPSYEQVCAHDTGHAEAVRVSYDPQQTSFAALLEVFFKAHDPTQKNRQGPDVGDQYRSAVFVRDAEQRAAVEAKKAELAASGRYVNPIATNIEDAKDFWMAEDYHQQYLLKRGEPQCHTP